MEDHDQTNVNVEKEGDQCNEKYVYLMRNLGGSKNQMLERIAVIEEREDSESSSFSDSSVDME